MVPPASQDSLWVSPPSCSESCQPICVLVPPSPLLMSSSVQLALLPIYLRGPSLGNWQSRVPHMAFGDTLSSSLGPDPHPLDLPSLQGALDLSKPVISAGSWCPHHTPLGACTHTAAWFSSLVIDPGPRPRLPQALCAKSGVSVSTCPAQDTAHTSSHHTLLWLGVLSRPPRGLRGCGKCKGINDPWEQPSSRLKELVGKYPLPLVWDDRGVCPTPGPQASTAE